jgi:WS/DGAT/MGAT family acyltransferase
VALGPDRAVGLADLDLEEARTLGARHSATVNDVVLASCALALGAFLRRRGDRCEQLRVMVPVNVRVKGTARELGNRISFMFVELPLADTPALEALRTVSEQTRARKASGDARDLQVALDALAWLPAPARRALARMSSRPEAFHAVVSNVPGPDQPLFLLGRRLRAAHPAVPLAEGHAVSIGVLSYHGRLHVGVYADRAAIPDADDLARGVAAAFDALRLADAEPPDRPASPWRRRARERRVAVRDAGGRSPN